MFLSQHQQEKQCQGNQINTFTIFMQEKKIYFTYCEAIKPRAVWKQMLQPDDSMLVKQQVLLIHPGLNTLISRSKFN